MLKKILLLMIGFGLFASRPASAAEFGVKDFVQKQTDKVIFVSGGAETELVKGIEFPFGIKIQTNGIFTVNGGKERTLLAGQKLDKNGMLSSPDGTLIPVMNHVVQKNNRVLVFRDGEPQPVTALLPLEDGTRVMPDGTVTRPNGSTIRLMDGQMILLTGAVIPARDTIMLKNGKVLLQKDGSPVALLPAQTIMMNDGTKVFGTGKILFPDGKSVQLAEDQILVVEGVVSSGLK